MQRSKGWAVLHRVLKSPILNGTALVGAFNQEKVLVKTISVIHDCEIFSNFLCSNLCTVYIISVGCSGSRHLLVTLRPLSSAKFLIQFEDPAL